MQEKFGLVDLDRAPVRLQQRGWESNRDGMDALLGTAAPLSEPAFGLPVALLPPDWMLELPLALASGGLIDEAVAVGDAFAELDCANAGMFAADVALILTQPRRGSEALARVEENLARFSGETWTHIRAAAVHAELDDPQRAEAALRAALVLARSRGDAEDVASVMSRLGALLARQPGREDEAAAATQESERWSEAVHGGTRIAAKVGRNDPCP